MRVPRPRKITTSTREPPSIVCVHTRTTNPNTDAPARSHAIVLVPSHRPAPGTVTHTQARHTGRIAFPHKPRPQRPRLDASPTQLERHANAHTLAHPQLHPHAPTVLESLRPSLCRCGARRGRCRCLPRAGRVLCVPSRRRGLRGRPGCCRATAAPPPPSRGSSRPMTHPHPRPTVPSTWDAFTRAQRSPIATSAAFSAFPTAIPNRCVHTTTTRRRAGEYATPGSATRVTRSALAGCFPLPPYTPVLLPRLVRGEGKAR